MWLEFVLPHVEPEFNFREMELLLDVIEQLPPASILDSPSLSSCQPESEVRILARRSHAKTANSYSQKENQPL